MVVVFVDSYIQHTSIVLAIEETTPNTFQMPIPLVVTERYEDQRVTYAGTFNML